MNIVLSQQTSPDEIRRAASLYEGAFPKEERRPTSDWLDYICHQPNFHLHIIKESEKNTFLGFITTWNFRQFIYAEHFAILPQIRGNGTGSTAFQHLLQNIGTRPLLLEVEPPANETSRRRIAFYERQGMHQLHFPYLQPSYAPGLPAIPLQLMCSQTIQSMETYAGMVQTIHKQVYGVSMESTKL